MGMLWRPRETNDLLLGPSRPSSRRGDVGNLFADLSLKCLVGERHIGSSIMNVEFRR
jgi:hypothetical protein